MKYTNRVFKKHLLLNKTIKALKSELPYAFKSWEMNWDVLSPFFKYPGEIRTVMYTTNIIECFHRQLRKATKTKSSFPSDQSLERYCT